MKFHGVLFFPVTPFAADGSLDEERLARHIEAGVAAWPRAACSSPAAPASSTR